MDYIELYLAQIHQFLKIGDLQGRNLNQLDNIEDLHSLGDPIVGLSAFLLLKHMYPLEKTNPHQNSGNEDQDANETSKTKEIGNHYQTKHYVVEISNNVGLDCRKLFYFLDIDLHHLY